MKTAHLLTFLFFLLLVVGMGIAEAELKGGPQLWLLLIVGITSILAIKKEERIFTLFFYLLLSIMLYVGIFIFCYWILLLIDPNRGTVMYNGERRTVMDLSWIWGALLGLIITPIFIWRYHKSTLRNATVEYSVTGLLFAVTLIMYIVNELM